MIRVQHLHFVSDSAASSIRAELRGVVASRLTETARRLTAACGSNGYTIEQLCAEVGISRRTFFNYFPSKDEAVLGVDVRAEFEQLGDDFLTMGSRGWGLVVEDMVALAIQHAERSGITGPEHADFFRAMEREPRLLARFIGLTREHEATLARLVAEREGTDRDDLRVQAAVQIFGTVMRSAAERLTGPTPAHDLPTAIRETFTAIRTVLQTPELQATAD